MARQKKSGSSIELVALGLIGALVVVLAMPLIGSVLKSSEPPVAAQTVTK